jgi:hypothetical protein
MQGESGGGVAETLVSTILVLAAILSAFVPFAGPSSPTVAAHTTVLVSGRALSVSSESFGLSAPVVSSAPPTGANFDYVLTIVLENKAICDILTSCNGTAPYLTSLAAASGLATNYHGVISPSIGDYFSLTAGSTFGCTADSLPNASACTREAWNATNIVDRLEAANLTWKAYQENMPSNCFAGNQYPYAAKHNPFIYYKDIATNASRCARDVPSGASNQVLLDDLASTATASNYMWFTPNLCHDMHDCNVTAGDTFLSGLVPQILNSTVFQTQRAALLITFDEDGNGAGSPDLFTVWAGSAAKHGFQSNVPYDHYSALRTIEANWNLTPLTANDTAAVPMNEFFPGLPTARFVTSPTWPKGNTTVTFDGSSSSSDVPNATLEYRWDWTDDGTWDTNWSTTPTGAHPYGSSGFYIAALQVQDVRGSNKTTRIVTADDLPPVTTATLSGTLGQNGWYTGTVTVTLNATDDRSGVAYTTYHLDGSPSQTYVNPIVVSADGIHTLTYHSADRAGNVEVHKDATFQKDGAAPATAVAFSGTLNGSQFLTPILVTLSPTDALSGVAGTPVQIDGGPATNYTLPFLVSNVGSHSVQYHSIDVAGNIEPTNSFSVVNGTISDVALLSRAVLNGTAGSSGWYTSAVTVTLELVNGTSPPDSIGYRLDGGAWTVYAQPFIVTGDGVHSLDFNATNGAGLNEETHHTVIEIDTTPPASTSTLSGTLGNNGWYISVVTVVLNATDNTSGVANLTYRIDGGTWTAYEGPFVLGEGRHAVDFYATDLAGIVEPMVSRSVWVDMTPPATTADLSGTPGHSPWYVSRVTVFLNASDATSGVAGLVYRVDGGPWTTYSGPFLLADGVHLVEYYATDVAGLVESTKSRTVAIDTVPPTTTIGMEGSVGANGWFVSAVTVSLNATDATSGLANLSYRVDGGPWLAYTGPFVVGQGVHTVEYFSVDLAGLSEAVHSQSIQVDTTSPVTTAALAGTTGSNGWYISDVVVTLSASDPQSGVANVYVRVDGGGWVVYAGPVTLADGTHVFEYYAVNNAGLAETWHSVTIRVDTIPPTTAISLSGTLGANGWYTSSVAVTLNATDATSGVANISYRIDGGAWLAYTGPFTLGEGSHVVDYFSSDLAGLAETMHSQSIAIDTTPPSTTASVSGTAGANGWYASTVAVSLSATDPVSGVSNVYSRVDGGAWQIYSGPVTITDGMHVLEYYAVNGAGLVEGTHSLSLAVDTTPPASVIALSGTAGANGWYVSNVTGSLSGSDATSGVSSITYRVDGGAWLTYNGPFVLGEGTHAVDYFASDQAGLVEAMHSTTVAIDMTPPTTTATTTGTAGTNGWYLSNVIASLSGSDSGSGVATVYVRVDGGTWAIYSGPITLTEGTHVLDYYAVDVAGLTEAAHSLSVSVDVTSPTTASSLAGTAGTNGWYTSNVTVSLTATDATSGVAAVNYRIDNGPWLVYASAILLGDGRHLLEYGASDVAGNLEAIQARTIAVDSSPPVTSADLSGTQGANGWYVTGVSATLTATDATSGLAIIYYRIDGGPWATYSSAVTLAEGRHVLEFRATDHAGNIELNRSVNVPVDTTTPVSSAVLEGSLGDNGWYRSNVTVSLDASDATSGVAQISYRLDNGSWLVYEGAFVLTQGEYTLEYFAVDAAGLVEPTHTTTIRINTLAPITTASVSGTVGANGWYISSVSVTLNASDRDGGISEIFYRLDGGSWTVYSGPFVVGDGRRVLDYYATDRSGNLEPAHSKTLSIDSTPPVASAILLGTVGENTWYVSNVTVTLDASDATSGVAGIRYRIDGGPWQPYGGPFMLGPGRHSVDVFAIDVAGLYGPVSTTMIDIDLVGPATVDSVAGIAGENGWYVSDATVTLKASDSGSGVASTAYRLGGGAWITYAGPFSISQGGRHVLEFASVDRAGNRGPIVRDSVDVEASKPYFLSLSGSANATSSPVRITWSAADNDSGIAGYEVRVDGGAFFSVGMATSVLLNLTDGSHMVQVKALDGAGQSTIGTLSVRVLSTSGAPFGSLFLVVGALVGGAIAVVAFRVWLGRRGPNEKAR